MPVWAELVVLGSGGSMPSKHRGAPAVLVRDWLGNSILLDAGEPVQVTMQRLGYSIQSLDLVAVTHNHGDHVNGLPGLLQSMYVNDRTRPLTIVAPSSVIEFVRDVLEATETRLGFRVDTVEATPPGGLAFSWKPGGDRVEIRWFKTCHTRDSVGYRVNWLLRPRIDREKLERLGLRMGPWIRELLARGEAVVGGRRITLDMVAGRPRVMSIAYTGDTAPCRSVIEAVRGVDVLVHDSTYAGDREREALERGHSTSQHAAMVAEAAGARVLVLAHISQRYRGLESRRLLREARRIHFRTVMAWDGLRIRVSRPR